MRKPSILHSTLNDKKTQITFNSTRLRKALVLTNHHVLIITIHVLIITSLCAHLTIANCEKVKRPTIVTIEPFLHIHWRIITNRFQNNYSTFKMANQKRKVHFSDSVEVISEDDENNIDRSFISTDQYSDNDEDSVESHSTSSNRSAWASSEISFFSDHQMTMQKLDLTPRKPKRLLESILDDAISTCEALALMSPGIDRGRKDMMPPQMCSKQLRLDRSLFSIRSNGSSMPPPPPLSHSCIIAAALDEIARWYHSDEYNATTIFTPAALLDSKRRCPCKFWQQPAGIYRHTTIDSITILSTRTIGNSYSSRRN